MAEVILIVLPALGWLTGGLFTFGIVEALHDPLQRSSSSGLRGIALTIGSLLAVLLLWPFVLGMLLGERWR